jgi:hypothetical protein
MLEALLAPLVRYVMYQIKINAGYMVLIKCNLCEFSNYCFWIINRLNWGHAVLTSELTNQRILCFHNHSFPFINIHEILD